MNFTEKLGPLDYNFTYTAEIWEQNLESTIKAGKSSRCFLAHIEELGYRYLYRREKGNISRVALLMGVSRGTAQTKLKHYGIHTPKKRSSLI